MVEVAVKDFSFATDVCDPLALLFPTVQVKGSVPFGDPHGIGVICGFPTFGFVSFSTLPTVGLPYSMKVKPAIQQAHLVGRRLHSAVIQVWCGNIGVRRLVE